jgi:RHS repeat-associated protein
VEKYLWQGLTRLLAVYDGSDNLLMRFEYADGSMPVAMEKSGAVYYLAYDQVGSLRAAADAAGNVVKRIDYDSFGNIIEDTNPIFDIPFGFAGGLHDRDTGLVRFGFRDYDPDTGRWTAKDPMLFQGGETDLYGYALNDPINFLDSDGLLTDVLQNPGVWWASVASGASAIAEGVAASATAIAAASVAAVAAAGAAGYFGTSALIKGTWLEGGIGVLVYDITHPQPTKTIETEGEPHGNQISFLLVSRVNHGNQINILLVSRLTRKISLGCA